MDFDAAIVHPTLDVLPSSFWGSTSPGTNRGGHSAPGEISYDGLTGKVVDGRETYMRNVLLAQIAEFRAEYGADPEPDDIAESAWRTFEQGAELSDGRWTPELLHRRLTNTLRRYRQGHLHRWGLLPVDDSEMPAQATERKPVNDNDDPWGVNDDAPEPQPQPKQEAPKPTETLKERVKDAPLPLIATPVDLFSPLPPRPWLIRGFALKGRVTVLLAPGGVGKTTLLGDLAVCYAAGHSEWAGYPIVEHGRVWVYNVEDDMDELRRRVLAVVKHRNVKAPSRLTDKLFINSGAERGLVIATMNPVTRTITRSPDVDTLVEEIRRLGITLLIVDPFAETHEANENDNVQMRRAAALFREVAQQANCAVVLVHHTSKIHGDANIDAKAGDMDAGRGASSVSGVARLMFTLLNMSSQAAEKMGINPDDKNLYVRLDDAKSNVSLISDKTKWFKRISVNVTCPTEAADVGGESVGVLEPWEPPKLFDGVTVGQVRQVMEIIDSGLENGQRYSLTRKGGSSRWAGDVLMDVFDVTDGVAGQMLNAWDKNGALFVSDYRNASTRKLEKGLFVEWKNVPPPDANSTASYAPEGCDKSQKAICRNLPHLSQEGARNNAAP